MEEKPIINDEIIPIVKKKRNQTLKGMWLDLDNPDDKKIAEFLESKKSISGFLKSLVRTAMGE